MSDLTRASEVAEYLAKSLADEPDAVSVAVNTDGDTPQIDVTVAQGDLGRVIGKRGRVANAFRTQPPPQVGTVWRWAACSSRTAWPARWSSSY